MTNAELAVPATADDGDRSLTARAAAGDLVAARALYDRHAARVFRLAYRLCGDHDLAHDLTQEVFVKVFRQLGQFRGDAAFTTWLHRVTVTTCINGLRKVKRFTQREVDLEHADRHETSVADRDPLLLDALSAAMDALPLPLRVALVMHTIEGYTHVEIASALGIAEGTSKSRVSEARAKLRELLATQGKEYRDG
ncbi:MAG TPA: sigma-70 family RNA polymerase sigma factor [Gemmatimonadales bacterium]|jgi:RNA polymerase sigma-70 factor (ECF subfamily)